MSAPLSKGHSIEKVERFWRPEEGVMRYMVVHRDNCRRCERLGEVDLHAEFAAIQREAGGLVIMVRPLPDGKWEVW